MTAFTLPPILKIVMHFPNVHSPGKLCHRGVKYVKKNLFFIIIMLKSLCIDKLMKKIVQYSLLSISLSAAKRFEGWNRLRK